MRKGFGILAVAAFSVTMLSGCGSSSSVSSSGAGSSPVASTFKAGLINVGDETETYTAAHINGFKAAATKLGIATSNIILKNSVPESGEVSTTCDELVGAGCNIIFTNSYGHQDYTCASARKYPNVTFVADTGDYAAITGLSNFKNAFTDIYEARYVSGLVGGLKLKELVDGNKLTNANKDSAGNYKIGYVGAYSYAEVVSGFTAFYLGVKDGFGASNVAMEVQFTDSWYDIAKESQAANLLVGDGCVIIGQHADSTGAPSKIQSLHDGGKECYSIGYNIDMLPVAATAALTSATNNWGVYYEYALKTAMNKENVAVDWAEGYETGAVATTKLGPSVASGTADAVAAAETKFKAKTFHVFDTSKFTVDGKKVSSNMVDLSYRDWSNGGKVIYQGQTVETVKTDGDVTYVEESVARSAPYFSLKVDGITWLNS
jgi:basic membrane protein A and related proteins